MKFSKWGILLTKFQLSVSMWPLAGFLHLSCGSAIGPFRLSPRKTKLRQTKHSLQWSAFKAQKYFKTYA